MLRPTVRFLLLLKLLPHRKRIPYLKAFCTGHDPARGSRQKVITKTTRVESSRVGSASTGNVTGGVGSSRVESGGLQIPRVGPGHPATIRPARDLFREKPFFISPKNSCFLTAEIKTKVLKTPPNNAVACKRVTGDFFFFNPPADGANQSLSSPRFHVFSYTSCVDLTQLHSQSRCFSGVSFGPRDSESASCHRRDTTALRKDIRFTSKRHLIYAILSEGTSTTW